MDASSLRRSLKPCVVACQKLVALSSLPDTNDKMLSAKAEAEHLLDQFQTFIIEAPTIPEGTMKTRMKALKGALSQLQRQAEHTGCIVEDSSLEEIKAHDAATWQCAHCSCTNLPVKKECFACSRPRTSVQDASMSSIRGPGQAKEPSHKVRQRKNKDAGASKGKTSSDTKATSSPQEKGTLSPGQQGWTDMMVATFKSNKGFEPREGDWFCTSCTQLNFKDKTACVRCQAPATGDTVKRKLKRGEWLCPKCQAHNFQQRALCHACKEQRLDIEGVKKGGDWVCQCGVMNFMSRNACRSCSAPQPSSKRDEELPKGDWACKCGERNFKKRAHCRRCHETNPTLDDVLEQGDWVCPSCSVINFASKFQCMECKQFRPSDSSVQQKMLPGDWVCSQCHRLNFSARFTCISCFAGKAAGSVIEAKGAAAATQDTTAQKVTWECDACGEANGPQMQKCSNCRMPHQFSGHAGRNQLLLFQCPPSLERQVVDHFSAVSKPDGKSIVGIKWNLQKAEGEPDAEITFVSPNVCMQAAKLPFPDNFAPGHQPFTEMKASKEALQGKPPEDRRGKKARRTTEEHNTSSHGAEGVAVATGAEDVAVATGHKKKRLKRA